MKLYTIIPYIEGVRLDIRGESLEQLFSAALEGTNRVMNEEYEKHLNKHIFTEEIKLVSTDPTSLLIDFLSEVLALSRINKAIFYTIERLEIYDNSLNAFVIGARAIAIDRDIKAVTYREADVKQNDRGEYATTIVFDI